LYQGKATICVRVFLLELGSPATESLRNTDDRIAKVLRFHVCRQRLGPLMQYLLCLGVIRRIRIAQRRIGRIAILGA
jgi:hypothetical protein